MSFYKEEDIDLLIEMLKLWVQTHKEEILKDEKKKEQIADMAIMLQLYKDFPGIFY